MNRTTTITLTENEFKALTVIYNDCLEGMGGSCVEDLLADNYTWTGAGILQDAGWSKHEAAGTVSSLCEKGVLSDGVETAMDATPAEVIRSNHCLFVQDDDVQVLLRDIDEGNAVLILTPEQQEANNEINYESLMDREYILTRTAQRLMFNMDRRGMILSKNFISSVLANEISQDTFDVDHLSIFNELCEDFADKLLQEAGDTLSDEGMGKWMSFSMMIKDEWMFRAGRQKDLTQPLGGSNIEWCGGYTSGHEAQSTCDAMNAL